MVIDQSHTSYQKAIGVIPARYNSSRLPAKLLERVEGKTLLQHTWQRSCRCCRFDGLYIVTDHPLIYDEAMRFGANVVMTPSSLSNGTERIAFAVRNGLLPLADIIVNVQGDEPLLDEAIPSALINLLENNPEAAIATAVTPLEDVEEAKRASVVKCVRDLHGRALYFSRQLIPYGGSAPVWRHVGVYAYRRSWLLQMHTLCPTPLQQSEGLEQLKFLEHGHAIYTTIVNHTGFGIDTPEDLEAFKTHLCSVNLSLSPAASALL